MCCPFSLLVKWKLLSHVWLFAMPWTTQTMKFSRPESWLVPSPGHLPNPRIEPRSPSLQEDSLPAEPPGKPKNTGVGSLSLLQQIFPTQESNRGLLHCRWILYQLSYQRSPFLWGYFQITLAYELADWIKQVPLSPQCGWASSNPRRAWVEQQQQKKTEKGRNCSLPDVSWNWFSALGSELTPWDLASRIMWASSL